MEELGVRCNRVLAQAAADGWIVDATLFKAGDYRVCSPRGKMYDLKGVLNGNFGSNLRRTEKDIREVEEAQNIAQAARAYIWSSLSGADLLNGARLL